MLRFQFFATGTKAALGCSGVMDKRDWSFENRAGCMLYPKPEFMAMVVTLRYRGTKPALDKKYSRRKLTLLWHGQVYSSFKGVL